MSDITIDHLTLTQRMALILQAGGSTEAEAMQVASNLVLANLSGHDSHGVGMIPRYVDAIAEGGLIPNTAMRVTTDNAHMLGIDGQKGYGQIVGMQAMELAIARAKQHGSCIMGLAHAHHLGRIGHFAEAAVAEGLVSLHFVNVLSRPVVASWGGGDGRYGTNPCCIGIPVGMHGSREPFVLDFATSRVAQGKMRVAYNKGETVPDGYLIDENGMPTNNPGVVVVPQNSSSNSPPVEGWQTPSDGGVLNTKYGALMPFGEHKGFGMAVACELLAGALCGGGTWHRAADNARAVYNAMLTIIIDPSKLGHGELFGSETALFIDWLKAGPVGHGFDEVLTAGEPERNYRAKRRVTGITIDATTWGELLAAGQKVGVNLASTST